PQPSPEIQLEREIEAGAVELRLWIHRDPGTAAEGAHREALLRESLVRVTALRVQLGELVRACHPELSAGFRHPGHRQAEVLVLLQRGADQLLQGRVLEELPPAEVGHGA